MTFRGDILKYAFKCEEALETFCYHQLYGAPLCEQ